MGTKFDSTPSPYSLHKHNYLIIKLVVLTLLVCIVSRLFFFPSVELLQSQPQIQSQPQTPSVEDEITNGVEETSSVPNAQAQIGGGVEETSSPSSQNFTIRRIGSRKGKCDIFIGDWVPNPSGPIYTNETCHVIQSHQDCITNGRPDSGYLYWRWKPRDCEIPRFDARKFLKMMKNKSWAFIGDSISRNHVQSLLCILSKVEEAIEVYHDAKYSCRRWLFPSYNFTLSVIWSPFLAKAATFEDVNGVSTSDIELHLDKLDSKWAEQFLKTDYMVIAGGKWFLKTAIYYENNKIIGCHYCAGKNLTELGFQYAYRKSLQLVLNHIATSKHKGVIFFRSATPDHFENGEWFSGGTCQKTLPFKDGEIGLNDIDAVLRDIELEEFEKAEALAKKNKVNLKLLDTTSLSLLRPDGHPGPYRYMHPLSKGQKISEVQNDCLHWCMPGPIDSWSDLVMEMVVNG